MGKTESCSGGQSKFLIQLSTGGWGYAPSL